MKQKLPYTETVNLRDVPNRPPKAKNGNQALLDRICGNDQADALAAISEAEMKTLWEIPSEYCIENWRRTAIVARQIRLFMGQPNKEKLRDKLRTLLREKISRQDLLILLMGYADGLTDSEIAEIIDQDVQFVRSRYAEAIRLIHESLAAEGAEEAEENCEEKPEGKA